MSPTQVDTFENWPLTKIEARTTLKTPIFRATSSKAPYNDSNRRKTCSGSLYVIIVSYKETLIAVK
jgi:hypothetical protein